MVKILQFTDCHLLRDKADGYGGLNPYESLKSCISLAKEKHSDAVLCLLTGDLTHDFCAQSYERLIELFSPLEMPIYCLPGNHDDADLMEKVLSRSPLSLDVMISIENWALMLLNTACEGKIGGYLSQKDLLSLEKNLSSLDPNQNVLIAMHHPLVPCGSAWMDENMLLENPQPIFELMDQYSQIRCVLWGHIHQAFSDKYNDVHLYSTPSTSRQFLPHQRFFKLDDKTAGFRWLNLTRDGQINTGIERIG